MMYNYVLKQNLVYYHLRMRHCNAFGCICLFVCVFVCVSVCIKL